MNRKRLFQLSLALTLATFGAIIGVLWWNALCGPMSEEVTGAWVGTLIIIGVPALFGALFAWE